MTLRQVKVLIADDSNPVHQLIRDSLPVDYSTNLIQAFDGVECLNALDQVLISLLSTFTCHQWVGWTRYGPRGLPATRPSLH